MKAVTWQAPRKISVEEVPDPTIQEPTDAIVRIKARVEAELQSSEFKNKVLRYMTSTPTLPGSSSPSR